MGRRGSRRKKTRQLVAQERLSLTLLDWRWKGTRRNVGNSLWKLEKARERILSLCVCVYVCSICVCVLSHVWLCNPMDCSLPGSSVNGISQARIWEWAISSSRGSFQPWNWTTSPALAGGFFTTEPPGKHLLSKFCRVYPPWHCWHLKLAHLCSGVNSVWEMDCFLPYH